jgi:molybdopterin synthase catalytic subunit
MIIRIQNEDFDIAAVNRELLAERSDVGAIASFIGLVRDLKDDGWCVILKTIPCSK